MLMDLLKSPWFYYSPSPWSVAVYMVLALYGSKLILSTGQEYRRRPRFFAFLDALLIVFVVVLIQDLLWLSINTIRWLPEYADKLNLTYWMRFLQNGAALAFCFYCVRDKFRLIFDFELRSFGGVFLLYAAFEAAHFLVAPDPSLTDWTYAIRFGYSDFRILWGFIMGHVVGKLWIALLVYSVYSPVRTVKALVARAKIKRRDAALDTQNG